jgi:hypothetical protein
LPRIYGKEEANACSKLLQSFAIAVMHPWDLCRWPPLTPQSDHDHILGQ